MIAFHGEERSYSILEQDHDDCELVKFLMDVGTCPFTEADIVARVIAENVERIYASLRKTQRSLDRAQSTLDGLIEKERYTEVELGNIPEGHPSRGAKSDELLQIRSQMECNRNTLDIHSKKLDSLNDQLVQAGMKTPMRRRRRNLKGLHPLMMLQRMKRLRRKSKELREPTEKPEPKTPLQWRVKRPKLL